MKDQIYSFMQQYQREHGENPRLVDIGAALDTDNRSHIYYYLRQMEDEGLVVSTKPRNFARRFQAVEGERGQDEAVEEPTTARVYAGQVP